MRIPPIIKLFIFSLVMSVLSCAMATKVTDIAELHYGDYEADIVEKFGRGDSVLHFWIDDTTYHYRSSATRHTHDEYALLFTNARLVAVSDEIGFHAGGLNAQDAATQQGVTNFEGSAGRLDGFDEAGGYPFFYLVAA